MVATYNITVTRGEEQHADKEINKTSHEFDIYPLANCGFLYNLLNVNILKDAHFLRKACYINTLISIANFGKLLQY